MIYINLHIIIFEIYMYTIDKLSTMILNNYIAIRIPIILYPV